MNKAGIKAGALIVFLFFAISYAHAGCVTVVSPNGGEVWPPGTSHNIQWSSSCPPGTSIKIILRKGGSYLGKITANIPASQMTFPWIVGNYQGGMAPEGNDYKILVKTMDNYAKDASNADFSISSTGEAAYNRGVPPRIPTGPEPVPTLMRPDLILSATNLRLSRGVTMVVHFSSFIKNTGHARAENIPVELSITGPAESSYNNYKTTKMYHSIPEGSARPFNKTLELKIPGKYYFTLTVDPKGMISEISEQNNTATRNITINAPDLIAWLITPRVHMTVEENVWIGVLNIGTAASNATRLKVKIEGKGTKEFIVPSLGPCEFKTDFERKEHFLTNEDKWVEMTVDPYGQVRELRKDNNFTKTKLDVRALTSSFGSGLVAPPVNLCLQH